MKLIRKIPLTIIFFALLVWQLLLTFQGLDLADTGFHLTAYRFIFDDPYSAQYSMMFWLSDVCGFLWMKIWPTGGLYWFRLGWVIIISFTFVLYLKLLMPKLGKRKAILSLAVTLVFILQGGPECLSYDIFSTLGYALGLIILYQGLEKNKPKLIFFSGLIFGISVFFKLSNLSALAFLLLIPFSSFINKGRFINFLKESFFWLLGFAGGVTLILFSIWQCGHLDLFLNNLSVVSAMGNDVHSSHGIKPMLFSYLIGYFNAFVCMLVCLLAIYIWSKSKGEFQRPFSDAAYLGVFVSIAILTVLLTFLFDDVFWSKIRYLFLGLMIFRGIVLVFDTESRKEIRMLALAGLILLLISPLGSDSGLEKSVWGMWILGPLLLSMPLTKRLYLLSMNRAQSHFLRSTIASVVLLSAIVHAWQKTYFDVGSRSEKIYAIKHPLMKGIYTSCQRANVVNELILQAFPQIKDEKYLLSFIEIPMVNYLCDKRPFISCSWPKLYYDPSMFKLKLNEALRQRNVYPAIIRQKQNTMLSDWPGNADVNYLNYPDNLSKWPEHGRILNEFIAMNNYQVVWENEMFQLLVRNPKSLNCFFNDVVN